MTTITCPSCGKQVASDAAFCPHCGKREPVQAAGQMAMIALLVLAAICTAPGVFVQYKFIQNSDESDLVMAALESVFSLWSWILSAVCWGIIAAIWFYARNTKHPFLCVAVGAFVVFLGLYAIGPMMGPMTTDQFRQSVMGKTPDEVRQILGHTFHRTKDEVIYDLRDYSTYAEDGTPEEFISHGNLKDPASGKRGKFSIYIYFAKGRVAKVKFDCFSIGMVEAQGQEDVKSSSVASEPAKVSRPPPSGPSVSPAKGSSAPTPTGQPQRDAETRVAVERESPTDTPATPVTDSTAKPETAGSVPTDSQTQAILVEGQGTSPDEALRDAFRNAVRQVVGSVVDAETLVKNDEIISDQVLTYSDGFIDHYDTVSTRQEGGLTRTRIRARVRQGDVATRLRAAKVAVKDVDGGGLFARAVTTLEAERAAGRMLRHILGDYPATVLDVEVISEPRIIDKTDREAKISYDVRAAVDRTKYDQLMKRVLPLMEQAAVRHGEYVNVGYHDAQWYEVGHYRELTGSFGVPLEIRKPPNSTWGGPQQRHLTAEVIGPHSLFAGGFDPRSAGDKKRKAFGLDSIDLRTQMFVLVNTGRDAGDNRTTWKWFHMPKADLFWNNVVARIEFAGSRYVDEFIFGGCNNGPCMPGLCLDGDKFETRYVGPWKFAVISPYFLQFYCNVTYATGMEWPVEKVLPLDDLKQVQSLAGSARIRKPSSDAEQQREQRFKWRTESIEEHILKRPETVKRAISSPSSASSTPRATSDGQHPTSASPKPAGKAPAPDDEAQQKALKVVTGLYGERYKSAETIAAKRTLIEDMLRKTEETDEPATRFVTLRVARDIAIKAGMFDLAAKTIVERDRGWIIDVIQEGRLVMDAAVKAAETSADQTTVVQMAVELQNRAVAAADLAQAVEFGNIAIKAARASGNSQLIQAVLARNKEVKALREGANTGAEGGKTSDIAPPTLPPETSKPEIAASPGFQVVWKGKGNDNDFIEARTQLTPVSALLELKAHNLGRQAQNGVPSADSALDQAAQQIVDQWRKGVPQYRGKAIKEKKRNDRTSGVC